LPIASPNLPNRSLIARLYNDVVGQAVRVLFATPEATPYAKTGGLGDVAGVLPSALAELGLDVQVLLPGYDGVLDGVESGESLGDLPAQGRFPKSRLIRARMNGDARSLVLDCPQFYRRPGGPYQDAHGHDWPDNAQRFAQLSRVSALLASQASPLAWRPDVLHCNDWQVGLAPAYLRFIGGAPATTVMTLHNLAYQGIFPPHTMGELGLPPESFQVNGLEYYGNLSFLKAGIYYADHITTVSPTYALEIQQDGRGFGMQGLLKARSGDLTGILNGIDTTVWDPAHDPLIPQRYSASRLPLKARNKEALQEGAGVEIKPRVPLFAVVSRFVYQKGLDLLLSIATRITALPAQLVLFGTGETWLMQAFDHLARTHPGTISMRRGFDERYAHLIEAGADAFLMPSRYEPCGLNQMYSQRYGTIPVVHATGGLADSVTDARADTLADGSATGFVFREFNPDSFFGAVSRAAAAYHDSATWRSIQRNAMARDSSWKHAALDYLGLYKKLLARKAGVPR
jgi:starch synthase